MISTYHWYIAKPNANRLVFSMLNILSLTPIQLFYGFLSYTEINDKSVELAVASMFTKVQNTFYQNRQ